MIRHRLGLIALCSTMCVAEVTSAQTTAAGSPAANKKALRESLLTIDRAVSAAVLAKGFTAALVDVLAPDAIFLYDGAPIVAGRANVLTLLDAQPSLRTMRAEWLPLVATVSTDGTLGATYGVTVISSPPSPTDGGLRFGKYIATWRRSPPGPWRLAGFVEMGLNDEKVVVPPALLNAAAPSSISGNGSAMAKADADFARMALARGAPIAFGAFASPDAATLPGTGEIVIGPTAINSRMLESPAATAKWDWRPLYAQSSDDGELGFTIGAATITIPGTNGPTDYHSKYLTVWKRQPDGTLRFFVDGGNGR